MAKVVLSGFLTVPPAQLAETKVILIEHIRLTKSEPGCIVFEVTPHKSDRNRFEVYEEFSDAESFRAHQTRVKASDWGRLTATFERSYQIQGLDD